MTPHALILTGMHRSGTSLVASILQQAGLHIGSNLMAADSRNPRGFFEDLDFFYFHERALQDRGTSPYVPPGFVFEPSLAEREHAQGLIESRRAVGTAWGWKDPRSTLFLDFWRGELPEARFLFVYRHPLEVLLSMVRRGEAHTVGLLEALTTWLEYNSKIRVFRSKHPGISLLCHTFTLLSRPEEFGRLMESRMGIPFALDSTGVGKLYHREELRRLARSHVLDGVLREIHPEAMAAYDALESEADLAAEPSPEGPANPALDSLAHAVRCYEAPHPPARARGFLTLLVAALDAEVLDAYYPGHERYLFEQERDKGRLQAGLEAESRALRQQSEWLAIVEANNQKKQDWIETLERDNHASKEQIRIVEQAYEANRVELARIHASISWRMVQKVARSAPGRLALRVLQRARRGRAKERT